MPVYVFTDKDITAVETERRKQIREKMKGLSKKERLLFRKPGSPFPKDAESWSGPKLHAWDAWYNLSRILKEMIRQVCPKRKIPNSKRDPMFAFEHNGKGTFTLHILQEWITECLNVPTTTSVTVSTNQEHYAMDAYILLVLKICHKTELPPNQP